MADTFSIDKCTEIAVIIGKEAASMASKHTPSRDITYLVDTALNDAKEKHGISDYMIFLISRFIAVYLDGANAGIELSKSI